MIFGGGETYSSYFLKDSKNFVIKRMYKVFPQLKDFKIDYSWGGTLAITINRLPSFGTMMNEKLIYAFGYSGNGVLTCYVGGEILSSMALSEQNAWTESNFCKGPLKLFPPEPFRWLGAMIIRNAVRRKEKLQEQERKSWWIDNQLAKLAVSVGRVDKK